MAVVVGFAAEGALAGPSEEIVGALGLLGLGEGGVLLGGAHGVVHGGGAGGGVRFLGAGGGAVVTRGDGGLRGGGLGVVVVVVVRVRGRVPGEMEFVGVSTGELRVICKLCAKSLGGEGGQARGRVDGQGDKWVCGHDTPRAGGKGRGGRNMGGGRGGWRGLD